MSLLKHIKRIAYIDSVIKRRATGNLDTFARKNELSKRAMTNVLHEMKELGFPIKYDRNRNTYYYQEAGEMVKSLFVKDGQILFRDELKNIGAAKDLCFSEITVYMRCKNI
jgi:hypothetical protein